MRASLKAAWIAALRSGEYTQGIGYLNANDKLCCLGVLCEVAQVPRVVGEFHHGGTFVSYANASRTLPSSCPGFQDLGTEGSKPEITGRQGYNWTLTQLNDSGEFNFSQIADLIDYFVAEEPDPT